MSRLPPTSEGGRISLLASSSAPLPVGYPEAFYAHTHKTPERSNRQKKIPTPSTAPVTPDSEDTSCRRRPSGRARAIGRLRPQQLNLFHNSSNSSNNNNDSSSSIGYNNSTTNANTINNRSNGKGNVGNGHGHIQQQLMRQQKPQSPPAVHASVQTQNDSNRSVASSAASTAYASQATLAATIPSSHINIITQAYGNSADIYRDILQIPRETSERDIRIAYFRRGRQVLAEKPDVSKKTVNKVSQLAKMKFQAVSMAYEILSNPAWKESYDLYGIYGPDSFQEPEGASVLLAEDASLADPTNLGQDSDKQSPATVLYNLRSKTGKALATKSAVSASEPTQSSPEHENTNSDNISCVSQSTSGSTTSTGVLRKPGSFLEKLNKQKASLRSRNSVGDSQRRSSFNDSPDRAPTQPTTVRWNEEVEELIFRQDPDEVSFKAGTSATPDTSEPHLSTPPPQRHCDEKERDCNHDNLDDDAERHETSFSQHAGAAELNEFRSECPGKSQLSTLKTSSKTKNNSSSKKRVVLDTAELGTHLNKLDKVADSIADIFDELEASFDGLLGGFGPTNPDPRASTGTPGGKPLLLAAPPKTTSVLAIPPLLPPPSHYQNQLQKGMQQQQQPGLLQQQPQPPPFAVNEMATSSAEESHVDTSRLHATVPLQAQPQETSHPAQAKDAQFEETSYHTPPISVGNSHLKGLSLLQKSEDTRVPLEEQEEAMEVEEQAMALLREVTASGSVPPSDVLIKTKKIKHHSHHQRVNSGSSDSAFLEAQGANHGPISQQAPNYQEGGEATSTCASDMAAGEENTTVATSVVSLLDPNQQSTNAPLKPAASTEISGAKASRKRLKNAQRRRQQQQQQRAKEQQQKSFQEQQEDLFDFIDPMNVLNPTLGGNRDYSTPHSVKDDTIQLTQISKTTFADPYKNKNSCKKKQTEDLYFESLYQNFFALPKERLPNEMTVRTRPIRGGCSVSTLSHSVTTASESLRLHFDPWDLANGAWGNLGEKADERERQSREHRNVVMARVDEVLAQRSERSGLDTTFDSSFPDDCSSGSETALDTTFDSTAMDTAFSSALDVPRKPEVTSRVMAGCDPTPGVAFLNNVFDVPLEAPLEYWCGEMKDCASSTKPKPRPHRLTKEDNPQSQRRRSNAGAKGENSCNECRTSRESVIFEDEDEDGPPTDESITLMDPPTHDSRLVCDDDSTLNTFNTNLVEEDSDSGSVSRNLTSSPPSGSPSPSVCYEEDDNSHHTAIREFATETSNMQERREPSMEPPHRLVGVEAKDPTGWSSDRSEKLSNDPSTEGFNAEVVQDSSMGSLDHYANVAPDPSAESPCEFDDFAKDSSAESPCRLVKVETASESQFFQMTSSQEEPSTELDEIESASVASPESEHVEEREGSSPLPTAIQRYTPEIDSEPSNPTHLESESEDVLPSPSSLSGRRLDMESVVVHKTDLHIEVQDEGNESSATSVSSTVSSERTKSSSFLTHMLSYLNNVTSDNPSLACIKANFDQGLESWRASNDACMDAIVINDEDMAGMLNILQSEMAKSTRYASE